MIFVKRKYTLSFLSGVLAFAAGLLFIRFPQTVKEGFSEGCLLCYHHIIPAVFPFFVIIPFILQSSAKDVFSLPLRPVCRLLKLSHPAAPPLLLFGILGGFAPFCQSFTHIHASAPFSAREEKILLLLGLQLSPSFIVSGIGFAMLYSSALGWILFFSVQLSSLITAFSYSLMCSSRNKPAPYTHNFTVHRLTVSDILSRASSSTVSLCGFVLFFQILLAFCKKMPAFLQIGCSVFLEVSSSCHFLLQHEFPYRIFLLLASLSFPGISILLQAKALLPKRVSLMPFLLSRLFHFPLACLLFKVLIHLFPVSLSAAAPLQPAAHLYSDWFQFFALLGMLFSFSFQTRPLFYLRNLKNRL